MDTSPETLQLSPAHALAIRAHVPMAGLPAFFGAAFAELAALAGTQMAGPPFAMYHVVSAADVDVSAVVPLRAPVAARGRAVALELAGGPAVQVRHVGPYEELGATYASLDRWLAAHHRTRADAVREVYLTGPEVPPARRVTLVIQPLGA